MTKLFKQTVYAIGFIPIFILTIPVGLIFGIFSAPKAFVDGWKKERKKLPRFEKENCTSNACD